MIDRPSVIPGSTSHRIGLALPHLVMVVVCLFWLGGMLRLGLHRWHGIGFGVFDIGIFDQGLWLLATGNEPFVTLRGLHLFADHASYLLFLLVPLYWIWADARLLIAITTLAPAVAGWLSYRIARVEELTPWRAVLIGMAVLAMPAMVWTPWDAFHPETVAIALLPASYLAARRGRFVVAVALAALILLAKEDAGLLVLPYAAYMWWRWPDSRAYALALAGLTVVVQAVSLLVVLPGFSPTGELIYSGRYVWDPDRLLTWSRAAYLPAMLIPGVLAMWAPRFLVIGIPITLANLATVHSYQHEIRWHYSAYLLGVLAVAVPLGSSKLAGRIQSPERVWRALVAALVVSVLGMVTIGPDLGTGTGLWSGLSAAERGELREMLDAIPPNAAVSATWTVAPLLAHRVHAYMAPNPFSPRFWGVDGTMPPPPDTAIIEYLAIDTRQEIDEIDVVVVAALAEGWEVVLEGTFLLLRRP